MSNEATKFVIVFEKTGYIGFSSATTFLEQLGTYFFNTLKEAEDCANRYHGYKAMQLSSQACKILRKRVFMANGVSIDGRVL
jgi:hypothetical protein